MDLSEELGFAASVVELTGNELLVSALYGGEQVGIALPQPGIKVPYEPPSGAAFAGFASASERNAWLARRGSQSEAVNEALERSLALSRERGYDIDWTTPAIAQMTTLVGSINEVHPTLLAAMDQILLEFTTVNFEGTHTDRPVTSITAPVLDTKGHCNLAIAVHPLRAIPLRRIHACGRRLVEAAHKIALAGGAG
jgi:DNA-binding IclR family transcriptional regulator